MKRWRFWVIFWPLCCLTLTGVMLYQWSAGMAYRDPVHAVFPIFSLLFFFIGMGMKKNSAKHREVATRLAPDATVAYLNTRRGNHGIVKTPVYRYTAGEISYTVSSRSSYSPCPVHTGEAVELYYSPQDPRTIYVPKEERTRLRWARLLCGIGVAFPFFALAAPWLTPWVESLP